MSTSGSDDDTTASGQVENVPAARSCRRCRAKLSSLTDFLDHQKDCPRKIVRMQSCDEETSDAEDMIVSGGEEEEEEEACEGEKRQEAARRQQQDAENNNSVGGEDEELVDESAVGFPYPVPPVPGHVTLEALQNTKVAVAQFAATALANSADNPAALQELAVLQTTLFTLQHQQMMQISLIQQLQNQLTVTHSKEGSPISPPPPAPPPPLNTAPTSAPSTPITIPTPGVPLPAVLPLQQSPPKPLRIPTPIKPESVPASSPPASQSLPPSHKSHHIQHQPLTIPKPPCPVAPVQPSQPQHPPLCSISSSLAASIITNNDPPPSLNEPNTLEMLQKRAQEVLDNASQGLLANNLADELAFRKNGKNSLSPLSGRNEPFFKHRCRYCGKVFGSDSALQIHIRSHTGERPFKCNVCGSRFTTKGNLKVHFQRHTSKFPHIKMNPNPVPEHLDKFHPPLLAHMSNQNVPHHSQVPHHPFPASPPFPAPPPGLPLFRPPQPHEIIPRPPPLLQPLRPHETGLLKPILPLTMFATRDEHEQDMPENLSKPQTRPSPSPLEHRCSSPSRLDDGEDSDRCSVQEDRLSDKVDVEKDENSRDSIKQSEEVKSSLIDEDEKQSESEMNRTDGREDIEPCDNKVLSPKKEVEEEDAEIEDEEHRRDDRYEEDRQSRPDTDEKERIQNYDECSLESKYSDEDGLCDNSRSDEVQDLSSKSPGIRPNQTTSSYPYPPNSSPHSSNSSGSMSFTIPTNINPLPHDIDPAKDPAIYNSLLPRPGSNDNSWESLIEVTKTSETYKLQQLVDNIEHKLTDPNQCVICHRVLSCKSALQMHYRIHTGERPFRCKICGRAFTTKGNLKTHMGVHRLKPPMRVLHQCPVCHKKFTNTLVLQQHIRLHTGEPTDLTPEQIQAAEIKDFPPPGLFPHPNFLAPGFPVPGLPPHGINLSGRTEYDRDDDVQDDDFYDEEGDDDDDDDFSNSSESQHMSMSLGALESQVRTKIAMASRLSDTDRTPEDLSLGHKSPAPPPPPPTYQINGRKTPSSVGATSPVRSVEDCIRRSPTPSPPQTNIPGPPSPHTPNSPSPSESNSQGALDLTPKTTSAPSPGGPGSVSQSGLFSSIGLSTSNPSLISSSALSSLTTSVMTSTAFSPIGMAVGPSVRGNTTCNICFKTFACHSALEIHYRSHTKERPFKCTICDRGFSTKKKCCSPWHDEMKMSVHGPYAETSANIMGNMKQHMLTHKIRDMPSHLFESQQQQPFTVPTSSSSQSPSHQQQQISPLIIKDEAHSVSNSSTVSDDVRVQQPPPASESPVKIESPTPPTPPIKRSPPEEISDVPLPKRQSSMPKHLCHVCNKNFSSSSALQIHMRTHTGDKPFRCTVCQKAFTTKGNLKVHMGTHMWSNGASRRGRRMSLDLPPIPMNPKDSEFLHRRPDLFYPYLPTPFLNGMQQKLNEISVIQSGNHHPGNGLHSPGSKFGNLMGYGGFGSGEAPIRLEHHHHHIMGDSRSPPPSDKPLSSPPLALSLNSHRGTPPSRGSMIGDEMPKSVWDIHFDRKSNHSEENIGVSSSPGLPPTRVEGLTT